MKNQVSPLISDDGSNPVRIHSAMLKSLAQAMKLNVGLFLSNPDRITNPPLKIRGIYFSPLKTNTNCAKLSTLRCLFLTKKLAQ